MTQPVVGTLTYLRHYNHSINSDLCCDPNHRLLFTNEGGLSSYKYELDGTLVLVDTVNTAATEQSCAIDTTRHFVFIGGWGAGGATDADVFCYSYDEDGNMTFVSSALRWGANGCYDLHVDTVNRIIVAATWNLDVSTFSYTNAGVLAGVSDADQGYNVLRAGIDAYNNLGFTTNNFGRLASYTYNPTVGTVAWVETLVLATTSNTVSHADAGRRFGFVGVTGVGLYPFSYNANGTNLAVGTAINLGGNQNSIDIDRKNFLVFLAIDTLGTSSFRYNSLTGALTHIDSEFGTGQGYRIAVDTINFMAFTTGGTLPSGIDIFSYIPETELALWATVTPQRGKAPLEVVGNSKLYWVNGDRQFGEV